MGKDRPAKQAPRALPQLPPSHQVLNHYVGPFKNYKKYFLNLQICIIGGQTCILLFDGNLVFAPLLYAAYFPIMGPQNLKRDDLVPITHSGGK